MIYCQNKKEYPYITREKNYFDKLFGVTPTKEGIDSPETVLYSGFLILIKDETSFTDVLLYGIEFDLLLLYILVYTFINFISPLEYLPIVVLFVFDRILVFIRIYFGERNISHKTLLDQKFML